jgi:hypothetical protein
MLAIYVPAIDPPAGSSYSLSLLAAEYTRRRWSG